MALDKLDLLLKLGAKEEARIAMLEAFVTKLDAYSIFFTIPHK